MMNIAQNSSETKATSVARTAGQFLGGLIIGFFVVIAVIEIYGQIGNVNAFEYQGY